MKYRLRLWIALLFFLGSLAPTFAIADCGLTALGYRYQARVGSNFEISLRTLLLDPQATNVTWKLSGNPSWVNLDTHAEKIKGTPTASDTGESKFQLAISCGDEGAIAEISINVVIIPQWKNKTLDLGQVLEGTAVDIDLSQHTSSSDNAALTYTASGLSTKAPWLTLTPQGKLSGTPKKSDAGKFSGITLTAKHPSGASAKSQLVGEVMELVTPPKWIQHPLSLPDATEDILYSAKTSSLVMHSEPEPLTYELLSGPAWLKVNRLTGELSGTPHRIDVGKVNAELEVYFVRKGKHYGAKAKLDFEVIKVNKPPKWVGATLPFPDGKTGTLYSQSLLGSVYDPDKDTLKFKKVSGPGWVSITADGTITGTPDLKAVGKNEIVAEVSDSQYTDTATLVVTVLRTNQAPVVIQNPIVLPNAQEDSLYIHELSAYVEDVDNDPLEFTLLAGNAPWLTLSKNGELRGTPNLQNLGKQSFEVRITDGQPGHTVVAKVEITVDHVNHAPKWALNPIKYKLYQGKTLSVPLSLHVLDIDVGDRHGFTKVSGPAWAQIANDGMLSLAPPTTESGKHVAVARVTDSAGESAETSLVIEVQQVNLPPAWEAPTVTLKDAPAGKLFSFDLNQKVKDPNKDTLRFTVLSGKPAWLTVAPNGQLTGVPHESDKGPVVMQIRAIDPKSLFADGFVEFKVVEGGVNSAPYWKHTNLKLGDWAATKPVKFDLSVHAEDADGDTLTFAKVSGPSWLVVSADGQVSGTPTLSDVGPFTAEFEVSDGVDSAKAKADGAVLDPGANLPPQWISSEIHYQAKAGQSFVESLINKVTDPTGTGITFAAVGDSKWLAIAQDGGLSGTPATGDVGENRFKVKATNKAGSAEATLVINVKSAGGNNKPLWPITPVVLQKAQVGQAYGQSLTGHVIDLDGDKLRFSKVGTGAGWVTVSKDGKVTGTPKSADLGPHSFLVKAEDPTGLSATAEIKIQVTSGTGTNTPPKWKTKPLGLPAAKVGQLFEVNLADFAEDADGDQLSFTAFTLPPWLRLLSDGSLSGIPETSHLGTHKFDLQVSDRADSDVVEAFIQVLPDGTPAGPKWTSPVALSVAPGSTFTVNLNDKKYVSHPNNDTLSFELVANTTAWASLSSTGSLRITPSASDVGVHQFTAKATDSANQSATNAITIEVKNTNLRPPLWLVDPVRISTALNSSISISLASNAKDLNSPPLPMTFSISSQPNWLQLSATGQLSGNPNAPGTYSFEVSAHNSAGSTTAQVILSVNARLNVETDVLGRAIVGAPTEVIWVLDHSWKSAFKDALSEAFLDSLPHYIEYIERAEIGHTSLFLSSNDHQWNGQPVPTDGNTLLLKGNNVRWLTDFVSHMQNLKADKAYSSPFWALTSFQQRLKEFKTIYKNGFVESEVPVEVFVLTPQLDQYPRYAAHYNQHWNTDKFAASFKNFYAKEHKPFRFTALTAPCPALGDPFGQPTHASSQKAFYTVAKRTGGDYYQWNCKSNLDRTMRDFARDVSFRARAMAKKRILLSKSPSGLINVFIGERFIAGNTGKTTDAWSYDPNKNAVLLHWQNIDLTGLLSKDEIRIVY